MANVRPRAAQHAEFDLAHEMRCASSINSCTASSAACRSVADPVQESRRRAHPSPCGLDAAARVDIHGHAGYYVGGHEPTATVGDRARQRRPGVAENMMSGRVRRERLRVHGGAGASAHGGLLVIDGDASLRCGISLKGVDIVVGGERRQLFGLHGAGGAHRHLRRRRGRPRRFAVRSGDLRARQGPIARRRCPLRGRWGTRSADPRSCWRSRTCIRAAVQTRRIGPHALSLEFRRGDYDTPAKAEDRHGHNAMRMSRPGVLHRMPTGRSAAGRERPASTARSSTTFSARRRPVCTRFADWARSAACRSSTTWCSWRASLSRYPLEGYREKRCATKTVLGTRFAKRPIEARDSDHGRRHELRRAVGQRQGGARAVRRPKWAPRRRPATAA